MKKRFPLVAVLVLFSVSVFAQFGDPFGVEARLDGDVVRLIVDVPADHYLYADELKVTDALGHAQNPNELPEATSIIDPDTGKAKSVFSESFKAVFECETGVRSAL